MGLARIELPQLFKKNLGKTHQVQHSLREVVRIKIRKNWMGLARIELPQPSRRLAGASSTALLTHAVRIVYDKKLDGPGQN